MYRYYVERRPGFDGEARRYFEDITGFLGVRGVEAVRYLNRYDVENVPQDAAEKASYDVFGERQSDCVFETLPIHDGEKAIIWEYLAGQYDQRADSAEQCLSLLCPGKEKPTVRCAKIVLLKGDIAADDIEKIKRYLINEVDSRLTDDKMPSTLVMHSEPPDDIPYVTGFINESDEDLSRYREKMGLAMDESDLRFMRDYFKGCGRDPTETEVRVLDTYWSDHCRHTTFLTELRSIKVEKGAYSSLIEDSLNEYKAARDALYKGKNKSITLMDMAVIGAKWLRAQGKLDDLEVSDENNACSVYIDVDVDGKIEKWILMFKNETHNHPTEIEPFGGAATCIGGAIRDPLSGRAWVYQAMRVTGAANPTVPLAETIKGKLPQIKLCRESAQGFSSYGNQIGLATGQVTEYYHQGYAAKRMELGAVIAAVPASEVKRETPEAGDAVILLGGGTGRDGIGGATGSSKVHTLKSVETCAAEVQKGNAVEERKIQRLFRDKDVRLMIRRSNDFGAGGVAVAVGELSPGLDIDLDAVPKKYEGLNGTEIAISESQERMAVVVREKDVSAFIQKAAEENLNAVCVARVTDTNRLVMKWRGKVIVDIDRSFLDAAGAHHEADALIESPKDRDASPLTQPLEKARDALENSRGGLKEAWLANIVDLACCSERGLCERFDGSIGSGTVLFPFGGRRQCTPEAGMAAKIPVPPPHETHTASVMAHGFDPRVGEWSPWHGGEIAVLSSLTKITCLGARAKTSRLSFQEFFGRAVDEKTWGYPAAALLGALDAQMKSGCAAIGGKDSMSGTFEGINVPHTLVSFATATEDVKNITSGALKKASDALYLVQTPYSPALCPDWASFMQNSDALYNLNKTGKIAAMYPVCQGGLAEALTKMAMGNRVGAKIDCIPPAAVAASKEQSFDLFVPQYGSVIVEAAGELAKEDFLAFAAGTVTRIGETVAEETITVEASLGGGKRLCTIPLKDAEEAWEKTLSRVYPIQSGTVQSGTVPQFALCTHPSLQKAREAMPPSTWLRHPAGDCAAHAKPLVVIPVFPGTNCEYDLSAAFLRAGADVHTVVFTNRSSSDVSASLDALSMEISQAQILALAGGFSLGDEPDGSGKFIAAVLRSPLVCQSVMELLKKRDGLILGICNGFQALIKTGLVPYGEIREMTPDTPTLTFNRIGRHTSRLSRTRLCSALSPWANDPSVLTPAVHIVPVSHGEGRVVLPASLAEELFARGQVFTQYVDEDNTPTMAEPDNPNGSVCAIEGLTSPCGRVLGKMGHSERTLSPSLIKNIPLCPDGSATKFPAQSATKFPAQSITQDIFSAAVRYFA